MSLFHGLSAFPITPCDAAGRVNTADLQGLVRRLDTAGVDSIGLLGSTGTYAYLDRAARQHAVTVAAEVITDTPLIVGAGALRTDDSCALASDAQAAGADALLIAPVSYTPLTADEVFTHYQTIAAQTDLPICIYNNPGTTHFHFDIPLLQRLADLPNIAAVKMPLPAAVPVKADLAALRAALPPDFVIGYSGDWGCAQALLAGADSWFSVLGGILPQIAVGLTHAARTGDTAASDAQNIALAPLWSLFQAHGGLRIVYAMANQMGLTHAQPPRPILPVSTAVQDKIAQALTHLKTASIQS